MLVVLSLSVGAISIHAPRERGDRHRCQSAALQPISIHAPRERGDAAYTGSADADTDHFNPRPPREGRQQRCTVLPADL